MDQIFIGLGANLDEPEFQLAEARWRIQLQIGHLLADSKVYRTQAWGKTNQPDFYNQVVQVASELSPADLMQQLLEIEKAMGRVRGEKWSARRIDLDLLFYGCEIIEKPGLEVPHPRLHLRNFVLVPMNEIAPGFLHPVLKRTVAELKSESPDPLAIKAI